MAENWIPYPELVELIGRDAAGTLCRNYGGIPLYIPRCAGMDCPLSRLIGTYALKTLVLEYGASHYRAQRQEGRTGEGRGARHD